MTTVTTVTGLAYGFMRYLMVNEDPFSAHAHPLQPWALSVHVMTVPALVFAIGWFWGWHVIPKLRGERSARSSGLVLLALAALMTLSGYALQVASSEVVRAVLGWTHGLSGGGFAVLLSGHALLGLRAKRSDERPGIARHDRFQVLSKTARSAHLQAPPR
jgi:hypothetical protein